MASLQKMATSGLAFWILVAAIGLYTVWPLRKSLKFGIDLVGGTYITLSVQTDKAIESFLINQMKTLKSSLQKTSKPLPVSEVVKGNTIELSFSSLADAQQAANYLESQKRDLRISTQASTIVLSLPEKVASRIKEEAVQSNIEVLRTRLDKLSVSEITIAQQGEKGIIVELPDVSDPQKAKAMIGKAAVLDFRLVEKTARSQDDILYDYDGELPADKEILPGKEGLFYLVTKYPEVTGADLVTARPELATGGQVVSFKLTSDGGQRFHDLTSPNYGKSLAIVLDGVVIGAPNIDSTEMYSSGQISGQTADSAKELALLLKSGAFVAPVTFEEERQIGPSLGEQSIKQGLLSCVVGLALLFLFSIFYYKISGLFAFIALLYNLLLVVFALAYLRATLTLPGIAGMVLTIGMAVDASILIFERIKEEFANGISFDKAVQNGFSSAMTVILDANITTLIVGLVLLKFGTGPIKGFAVTMIFGILATLVTGLFFLKSLFNFVLNNFKVNKISI